SAMRGLHRILGIRFNHTGLESRIYEPFPANIPIAIQQPSSLNWEQRLKTTDVPRVLGQHDGIVINARFHEGQRLRIGMMSVNPSDLAFMAYKETDFTTGRSIREGPIDPWGQKGFEPARIRVATAPRIAVHIARRPGTRERDIAEDRFREVTEFIPAEVRNLATLPIVFG